VCRADDIIFSDTLGLDKGQINISFSPFYLRLFEMWCTVTTGVTNDTFINEAAMSPSLNYACINTVLVNGHYIVAIAVANLN
jgi:hypothetical protein